MLSFRQSLPVKTQICHIGFFLKAECVQFKAPPGMAHHKHQYTKHGGREVEGSGGHTTHRISLSHREESTPNQPSHHKPSPKFLKSASEPPARECWKREEGFGIGNVGEVFELPVKAGNELRSGSTGIPGSGISSMRIAARCSARL